MFVHQSERQAKLQERASAMLEWLASDACHALDGGEFIAALGGQLADLGMPLHHLGVHIQALSPTIFGRSMVWNPGQPIASLDLLHGERNLRFVKEGPLGLVTARRQWLVIHPDDGCWSAVAMRPFTGMAEVWIAPMVCGPGEFGTNAVSFGTRKGRGFHQDCLALFDWILPAIRNAVELKIWPRMTAEILDTYLGEDPEKRVLSGRVRRGDVETIEAAIMFCDMCGFTELSNRVSSERSLDVLNRYFDEVVPSVTEHGGEVLKFMGDGLLAIFRTGETADRTCASALDCAQAIGRNLQSIGGQDFRMRAGIGLHFGEVSYGNIGSGQRLDFTVVGRDVNLASRIHGLCAALSQPVLLSERFASLAVRECLSAGRHALKGFEQPVELFAPVCLREDLIGVAR